MKIHVVQPGDNLASLADRYKVKLERLLEFNQQVHQGKELKHGTKIMIPTEQIAIAAHNQPYSPLPKMSGEKAHRSEQFKTPPNPSVSPYPNLPPLPPISGAGEDWSTFGIPQPPTSPGLLPDLVLPPDMPPEMPEQQTRNTEDLYSTWFNAHSNMQQHQVSFPNTPTYPHTHMSLYAYADPYFYHHYSPYYHQFQGMYHYGGPLNYYVPQYTYPYTSQPHHHLPLHQWHKDWEHEDD